MRHEGSAWVEKPKKLNNSLPEGKYHDTLRKTVAPASRRWKTETTGGTPAPPSRSDHFPDCEELFRKAIKLKQSTENATNPIICPVLIDEIEKLSTKPFVNIGINKLAPVESKLINKAKIRMPFGGFVS